MLTVDVLLPGLWHLLSLSASLATVGVLLLGLWGPHCPWAEKVLYQGCIVGCVDSSGMTFKDDCSVCGKQYMQFGPAGFQGICWWSSLMRTIFTLKGSHGEECFPPFAQETFLNIHTKDLKILTELEILKRVTHLFFVPLIFLSIGAKCASMCQSFKITWHIFPVFTCYRPGDMWASHRRRRCGGHNMTIIVDPQFIQHLLYIYEKQSVVSTSELPCLRPEDC